MKRENAEAGRYIQAVSRFFIEQRGAPFFLSSREVENIKEWKKKGIPLQIVLEGIKDCFAAHKRSPGRKSKILSLGFCRTFVLRAFSAHKERKVGGRKGLYPEEDKRKKQKNAVERFLTQAPEMYSDLRAIFCRVLQITSRRFDEDLLEELETEAEMCMVDMADEAERDNIRREVMAEFGDISSQERERIQTLKLIKHIREKYGIPHIPLYYY